MQDDVHALYEELFLLDEIAGQLDDEANKAVDCKRQELRAKILRLQAAPDPDSAYELLTHLED